MKKILIIMRHAQAEFSAQSDTQRTLTVAGEQQATRTGLLLKQAGFTPQLILCSPLLRARKSAQLAAQAWDMTPQDDFSLDGRLSAAGLLEMAQDYLSQYDCVMLVGHNPNVSLAAGLLTEKYISFRPADAAVFDVTDFHQPKCLFQEIS